MVDRVRTDRPRRVSILGATGSIGQTTLGLLAENPAGFELVAVTAHRNVARLAEIARQFRVQFAAIGDETLLPELRSLLTGTGIVCGGGLSALSEAAAYPSDLVMAAMVGASGLVPTLTAIRRGAMVGFANKEVLVCAGHLVMAEAAKYGAKLLPVDSEHNAIFQVIQTNPTSAIERIILTASGGPFLGWSLEEMARATRAQAVRHPIWSMGDKISIDSATMMNKGLEIIEAHHLFALPEPQIEVVIHPQSVVHSLVAYCDGSVLAELGTPDMRTPIAYALAWPKRMAKGGKRLDLSRLGNLSFAPPDPVRFPALRLARAALAAGNGAATVLNAANEVAVAAFLKEAIGFNQICAIVEECLAGLSNQTITSLDDVFALDREARHRAEAEVKHWTGRASILGAVTERSQAPWLQTTALN
ncbi:MAG: 1-deoxy-D-xylulose-5-phosphate reductoisomerase [Candidatus Pacebacteria bacterium]|nr:1-deoxy-D-xylulose-5-phosphate reductoisomerase [Candidatus Paceibacterota bacterium]